MVFPDFVRGIWLLTEYTALFKSIHQINKLCTRLMAKYHQRVGLYVLETDLLKITVSQ